MYIIGMHLSKKYMILYMSLFLVGLILPSVDISNTTNQLLTINKLDHNFSFSMGTQAGNSGSSSFYKIGDRVTYNFSENLMFTGDFDLIFSSSNYNHIDNAFNQPKLNFDIGFKYNFNENTNFQLRIVKNSLNPNCNTLAF